MRSSPFTDPRSLKAFRDLEQAVSYQRQGQFEEAEKTFSRVVKKNPEYFDALHFYGLFKYQRGQLNDALKFVRRATKINLRSANAFNSLGVILAHLDRHIEALVSFDDALKLEPNNVQALSNKCNSLNELGRYQDAISSSDRVIAIDQNYVDVYIPRGAALLLCRRYTEALESYERSIRFNPSSAMAWCGRGNVFYNLKRYDEAFAAYDKALALKSDLENAWFGRGNVFNDLKRYDEAFAAYDKAFALKPDLNGAEASRIHAKMHICDWSNYDEECNHLIASVREGRANAPPFTLLAIPSSSEDQLQCAKLYVAEECPSSKKPIWRGERYSHDRVHVGYLSADFHEHATSHLMAGLFECHDKSRFEITAISIGIDDNSEMRRRLMRSFDHFIDAKTLSDTEAASRIKQAEIDILIDLKGFTEDARTNIFAQRPAPIQVNYLGYPGTMGAGYIDYIIADRTVIPEDTRKRYSEKIALLPDTYQPNDRNSVISNTAFNRSALGLPSQAFVFCCFNNNHKITPLVFDYWMRILAQVQGSVLWLREGNSVTTSNLRKEAAVRGIDADRLVFAKPMPLSDHLARHRLADLFLDTLPYNAHTTASDALWAGLPVLTCIGKTFAGRVAASLLNAINLPELITTTFETYEMMAVDLATHPEKMAAIKHKLAENRLTTPLFDTKLFTKYVEAAYTAMYERHRAGLAPDDIFVPS